MRRILLCIIPVAALLLAACGEDEGSNSGDSGEHAGPALEHVHGLGVDPRDGTLYVATHTGLFSAPPDESKAARVGSSEQDIMGFSVVEAGRFIGSGHPAPGEQLPPNLGLIESRDGGKSWKPVSLMGEADFHVLQSSGEQVYGYDGTQGRLMVSENGGQDWTEQAPPASMFSLAIDPTDPSRVVAATETGLHSSTNRGDDWRALREDLAGLLAWPTKDRLYLVDGAGDVRLSSDSGRDWEPVGSIGGQPAAFMSHGDELYAALADGTIKRSTDGGATWTVRAVP
jgi:photosystem II stability/assembly factor-like uncharacterized protein